MIASVIITAAAAQKSKLGKMLVHRREHGATLSTTVSRGLRKCFSRGGAAPIASSQLHGVGGQSHDPCLCSARVTQVLLGRAQRHVHDSATMSSSSLYSTFFLCTTNTLMGMYLYGTQDGGGTSPTPRSLMTVCMIAWLGEW